MSHSHSESSVGLWKRFKGNSHSLELSGMSLTKKPGNETPLASAKKPRFGNVGLPSREPGLRLRCRAGQPECGVGENKGPTADKATAGRPIGPTYRSLERSVSLAVLTRSHVLVKGKSCGLSVSVF